MAVLNALRRTPSALRRNPVLLVPILALSLIQVPQLALQAVDPLLSSIVSLGMSLVFLVVMPFFHGGLIAMADEALDGRTALQTFVDDGKANYVSLLVAYLALMAVNFALGMVAFFVALFGGIFVLGGGGLESASLAVLAAIGIVVAIVVLLYLLVLFFLQFYGQAIVLEDMGAVDGLKHSASVVSPPPREYTRLLGPRRDSRRRVRWCVRPALAVAVTAISDHARTPRAITHDHGRRRAPHPRGWNVVRRLLRGCTLCRSTGNSHADYAESGHARLRRNAEFDIGTLILTYHRSLEERPL